MKSKGLERMVLRLPSFAGPLVSSEAADIHLSLSLSTIESEEDATLNLLNLPSVLR